MKPTENNPLSDDQFDALLRHAMLDKEELLTGKNSEQMANYVFSPIAIGTNAEQVSVADNNTVVARLVKDFATRNNRWKMNLFMVIGILSLMSLLFFFSDNKEQSLVAHNDSTKQAGLLAEAKKNNLLRTEQVLTSNPLPVTNMTVVALFDSLDKAEHLDQEIPQQGEHHYVMTDMHLVEDYSLHYEEAPVLTEAQKIQTGKDKLKILKDIANPKKKTFGMIKGGKTMVDGTSRSVQSFYIQNAEVTNFQYRTFLNDLLCQGRDADYLLAAPVKGNWKTIGIPEFENVYAESSAYNDFPAVNMSREGAEMYCKWLTTSMTEAIKAKSVKLSGASENLVPDFYLPSNVEWIYAARGGDSTAMKFPWGKFVPDSVNNTRGCFLCDFNWTVTKDLYAGHHICESYQKLKQGGFHRAIVTTAGLAIDTLLTCPVYSYNPNTTGQYNMLGDVSEMVYTYNFDGGPVKGAPRAMGANWNSPLIDVQIESPEQYVGVTSGSALIGFRPIWRWLKM